MNEPERAVVQEHTMNRKIQIAVWALSVGLAFFFGRFSVEIRKLPSSVQSSPAGSGGNALAESTHFDSGSAPLEEQAAILDWPLPAPFDFEAEQGQSWYHRYGYDAEMIPGAKPSETTVPGDARLILRPESSDMGVHYLHWNPDLLHATPRGGPGDDPQIPRRQIEDLLRSSPGLYDSIPEVQRLIQNE